MYVYIAGFFLFTYYFKKKSFFNLDTTQTRVLKPPEVIQLKSSNSRLLNVFKNLICGYCAVAA